MRCCTRFLGDFQSISIKMAKIQNISLTPGDITGNCDRLRCCLNYEYCQYEDALKGLPKRNQRVMTPNGEGRVVDLIPLQEKVVVEFAEEGEKIFDNNVIQKLEGGPSPAKEPRPQTDSNPMKQRPNRGKLFPRK
jgi:cell fate regulator YaaT (PSP1 superfamily)